MKETSPDFDPGVKTVYTTCICNCGSTAECIFKVHVKEGVIVAVEPDDRYNTGAGREDEVLSEEDLWDKDFLDRYVEPVGFSKWKDYVLSKTDGVAKTPEWAEVKCAVPAETITALAKLLGTVRLAWLWSHWGVSRKSRGEQTVRTFAALQAMLGYWGTPGAGPIFHTGPIRHIFSNTPLGPMGEYSVPKMYRSHYRAQAVLLLDRVKAGELSEQDCMRMVGYRADPSLLKEFNPKMLFWGGGSKPAVVFKPADEKQEVVSWDPRKALELWQKRTAEHGRPLPDLFQEMADVTEAPTGIVGRNRLVLKAKNCDELMYYTSDNE